MRKTRLTELIVALDVQTRDDALRLVEELDGVVDFFKIGKELFTSEGPEMVRALKGRRLFLDLKFHDIPNTVAGAVRAAGELGVHLVDVHCSGGVAMMEAASAAASEFNVPPGLYGVTVLTHLDESALEGIGFARSPGEQVERLAKLALDAGLDGVVASAHEIESVHRATEGRLELLVPGIRPEWASASQDQRRVATPTEAARLGARYIVVGRPIRNHSSPRDAAKRIVDELASRL